MLNLRPRLKHYYYCKIIRINKDTQTNPTIDNMAHLSQCCSPLFFCSVTWKVKRKHETINSRQRSLKPMNNNMSLSTEIAQTNQQWKLWSFKELCCSRISQLIKLQMITALEQNRDACKSLWTHLPSERLPFSFFRLFSFSCLPWTTAPVLILLSSGTKKEDGP